MWKQNFNISKLVIDWSLDSSYYKDIKQGPIVGGNEPYHNCGTVMMKHATLFGFQSHFVKIEHTLKL